MKTLTFGGSDQPGLIVWQCQPRDWLGVGMRGETIDRMTHAWNRCRSAFLPLSTLARCSWVWSRPPPALGFICFQWLEIALPRSQHARPCQPAAPSLVRNTQGPTDES
ncbi:hypothetical protein CgunFtcFv8_027455 [Champsocephalus gunnari]|uniref:Uncharacterized protein n=1 Tax=Champsocephalus gunnari TaxID=52237 RepID=A0AAN8HW72_CHAGU|nr:hypothetical protein CgunFtcFv8_027455 [Champsocephalus gunnari]